MINEFNVPDLKDFVNEKNSLVLKRISFSQVVNDLERYIFGEIDVRMNGYSTYDVYGVTISLDEELPRLSMVYQMPSQNLQNVLPALLWQITKDLEDHGFKVEDVTFNRSKYKASLTIYWNINNRPIAEVETKAKNKLSKFKKYIMEFRERTGL